MKHAHDCDSVKRERDTLKSDVERLAKNKKNALESARIRGEALDMSAVEIIRLRGAIMYYGDHHPDCINGTDDRCCDCGWNKLSESLPSLEGGE